MMEYSDFYDLAVYANDTWKGNFSQKEIATNAYNYLMDFEYSKAKGTVMSTIQKLIDLLLDDWYNDSDGNTEVEDWLWDLCNELKLVNAFKAKDDIRYQEFVRWALGK